MVANSADFPDGDIPVSIKLAVLGFDEKGHKGGGIDAPKLITLPKNTVLFRLYSPNPRDPSRVNDFGEWWFTPFELRRICEHFGCDTSALLFGRNVGLSAFHGAFALLKEWYGNSPNQLSDVNVVQLTQPLFAVYGHGAPANSENYQRTLKPIRFADSKTARQVYIHDCHKYRATMIRLTPEFTQTDAMFGHPKASSSLTGPPKSFERL